MRLDDVLQPKGEPKGETTVTEATTETQDETLIVSEAGESEPSQTKPTERPAVVAGQTGELTAKPVVPHPASASPQASPRIQSPASSPVSTSNVSFGALHWYSTVPAYTKQPLWESLPAFNRFLTIIGSGCLLLALGRVAVPPMAQGVQQAYYPYTAAGKQETCLTHLRSVALAMATYAQDNDKRFPPLDYQTASGQRTTWVSLMKARTAAAGELTCPVGPNLAGSSANLISSYALNPVVATARASEMDDSSATLLLADAGKKHDVSLLPPYPTWPSYSARRADGGLDAVECNFDFRHNGLAGNIGQAGVVYADGHAATLSSGSWASDSASWGGSAVLRGSRSRLSLKNPQAGVFFKRLQADDVPGAVSYLSAHRAALKPISGDVLALWRLNTGEHTSDSIETLGWQLAQAWKGAGDNLILGQLNEEQTRRCQAAVAHMNNNNWEARQVDGQPSLRVEVPALWKTESQSEGRYRRLFARSALPSVFVHLEVGSRSQYVNPQPINWGGSETELKRRYGKDYRRLNLGSTLLAGQTASIWDYEIEKGNGPRLHKRLIGYTDGWNSYVISVSAPAKDWILWQPIFDKMIGLGRAGYL